jgi:hypothetical protein
MQFSRIRLTNSERVVITLLSTNYPSFIALARLQYH